MPKPERLTPNYRFDDERLAKLKEIAPECFADGKVNWDVLKEALGEYAEDETDTEHFGLFWPGKREARKAASIPSTGTLIPVPGEGMNPDATPDDDGKNTSQNIFVEGENLEVLKLLQKSYAGKIKMIYIDPPYNTGNDFVYDDNFTEPLEEYLRRTGQIDVEGKPLTANTKADGRFHSKWLNMMYPRLRLARNLLKDDGFIFISIDDNEGNNLRLLLNEIFGEENFIDTMIWKKRYGGGAKEKYLVSLHEYIYVYAKDINQIDEIFIPLKEDSIGKYYKGKDEKHETRGPYRTHPLEAGKVMGERKNLVYPIPAPDGTKIMPKRQWLWGKDRAYEAVKNNELEFIKARDGSWAVHTKQYLRDEQGNIRPAKAFSVIEDIYTQHGTNEITKILGSAQVFSYPKPTALIKQLLSISTDGGGGDVILDFFAGSGTSVHAVLDLNKEDGGTRRIISVQLPEPCDEKSEAKKAGFNTIAEITKERIRRAAKTIKKELPKADKDKHDLGFKVYKLVKSHYKAWQDYKGTDINELTSLFAKCESPLVEVWKKDGLIAEVMLIEGFPLTSTIEKLKQYGKNDVRSITSDFCEHKLLVCLDDKLYADTIKSLNYAEGDVFICLDSAVSDEQKAALLDKGILKTI